MRQVPVVELLEDHQQQNPADPHDNGGDVELRHVRDGFVPGTQVGR